MLRQHVGNLTMRHPNTLRHHLGRAMPRWRLEQLAKRRAADRRVRTLPCWSQFIALVLARRTGITSLRELAAALASHANHADHLGLGPIRRSTLAEADAKRPLASTRRSLASSWTGSSRVSPRARAPRCACRCDHDQVVGTQ